MTQSLIPHLEEAAQIVADDWQGHDAQYFETSAMMTIMLHIAKVKTLVESPLYAEKRIRRPFLQAVLRLYYPKKTEVQLETALRRTYEELGVYEKYAKPSDSVKETSERIRDAVQNWSHALPGKTEEAGPAETTEHNHIFVCKCGETYHS